MKYSFIVPMYNVEDYIRDCIDGILKMNYKNYEIIVIDDCSTDHSVEIVESYSCERVRIIHCDSHYGVSKCRNIGLHEAKGDYIVFIDSDDYYNCDFLSEINDVLKEKEYDVVISSFETHKDYEGARNVVDAEFDVDEINDKNMEDVLEYFYKKRMINTVWRFIIKRDLIIKNKLYFIENIIHEDEEWVPKLLCHMNSIYYFDKKYYTYRIRKNSITSEPNIDNYKSYIKVSDLLLDYSQNETVEYKKSFYLRNAYKNCFQSYLGIRELSNPIRAVHDYKVIKPNILIFGPSRIGKTTLAKNLCKKLEYNLLSMDQIVSSFEHVFPEIGINHTDRTKKSTKLASDFIIDYFNRLSNFINRQKQINYIVEGCYLNVEDAITKIDFKKTIFIVLVFENITLDDLYNSITKYDTKYDWTFNLNDKDKKEYCKNILENNKEIIKVCKKNNIQYFEIGKNRGESYDAVIQFILEEINAKTKFERE